MSYKNGEQYSVYAINAYNKVSNNFSIFKELIEYLKINSLKFNIVHIDEILNNPTNKLNVSIRCDIDCDIITGKKMSKYFHKEEIKATFYVLHTSFYYRKIKNYPITRQNDLKNNILQISNKYCKIGLHLDPLEVYIQYKGDGTKEVENEIKWLRDFVPVTTVCAHNSYPVYGAENFEIFKEISYNNRISIKYKDQLIPLSCISLKTLGVTEINYPIIKQGTNPTSSYFERLECFKETVFKNKIFKHGYNINIWCTGNDEWLISDYEEDYFAIVTFKNVINYLNNLKLKKNSIVFNLHPVYFSK